MKKVIKLFGGAWKVAYADFVTAMMALFMVLWISSQEEEILIATASFFQNPFESPLDRTSGILEGQGNDASSSEAGSAPSTNLIDMAFMHNLANEMYRMLNIDDSNEEKPIDIQVTSDGLRLVVFNRHDRKLFNPGEDEFTGWGELVVQNLAWTLDRNNMSVRIDSHTKKTIEGETEDYGPWELSIDRANRMRKALVHFALDPSKVERVTGFANTKPKRPEEPDHTDNDRIELSMVVD